MHRCAQKKRRSASTSLVRIQCQCVSCDVSSLRTPQAPPPSWVGHVQSTSPDPLRSIHALSSVSSSCFLEDLACGLTKAILDEKQFIRIQHISLLKACRDLFSLRFLSTYIAFFACSSVLGQAILVVSGKNELMWKKV